MYIYCSQKNNITPVLCVGEDLDTRNKGFLEVEKFISNQINKAISKETDIRNSELYKNFIMMGEERK